MSVLLKAIGGRHACGPFGECVFEREPRRGGDAPELGKRRPGPIASDGTEPPTGRIKDAGGTLTKLLVPSAPIPTITLSAH
jgi:hypothetical protein